MLDKLLSALKDLQGWGRRRADAENILDNLVNIKANFDEVQSNHTDVL